MAEAKNGCVFDDGKISKQQEFTSPDELYQDLIRRVQKYHPSDDISMIAKAYQVAKTDTRISIANPESRTLFIR